MRKFRVKCPMCGSDEWVKEFSWNVLGGRGGDGQVDVTYMCGGGCGGDDGLFFTVQYTSEQYERIVKGRNRNNPMNSNQER